MIIMNGFKNKWNKHFLVFVLFCHKSVALESNKNNNSYNNR